MTVYTDSAVEKAFLKFIPYGINLYYLEIIVAMFILSAVAGKIVAVLSGLLLAALLTWHILGLQQLKNQNRIIQLYLMDFHVAFSLVFLFRFFFYRESVVHVDIFLIFLRSFMVLFEIPSIFVLSGTKIGKRFS